MTRFLAAALLTTSSSLAFADTFEVVAPIVGADIYPDGAIIERLATQDLEIGTHTLILTDLPKNWDTQTLGLNITPNAQVTALTMQTGAENGEVRARLDTIDEELAEITKELTALQADHATSQAEFEMVERFMNDPDLFAEREDASAFWTFLVERHAARKPELARYTVARDVLIERRSDLNKEIAELKPELTTWQIKADVRVLDAGEVALDTTYYTNQASWRTSYDIALETEASAPAGVVNIEHSADIYQNTGEDWAGIAATLHSNSAQRPIYAPALFTWHVGPQYRDSKMGDAYSSRSDESYDVWGDAAFAKMGEPRMQQATVSSGVYNAVYALNEPLSLTSTSQETQKVVLERAAVEADLWAQTTAETSDQAVLMASLDSSLGAVGLPGAAKFYRNGSLIGRGQMPALIPGAPIEIPFGIDPLIEVSRMLDEDEEGDRGFIGRMNTLKRTAITTLTNNHDFAMPIRALEATPVPLHEDIELSILRGSTAFDVTDYLGQKGVNAWTPEIDAGQTLNFTFGYQISWPEGMNIGL